jgi:hypothetical protein
LGLAIKPLAFIDFAIWIVTAAMFELPLIPEAIIYCPIWKSFYTMAISFTI